MTDNWPASAEELRAFIAQFEEGTWPKDRWNHRPHVTMALYYLFTLPAGDAIRRVKQGIVRYNQCRGIQNTPTSGYHETLTSFWIAVLTVECAREESASTLHETVRQIATRVLEKPELWRQYYSRDLIHDSEARRRWVEPDLQVLPCAAAAFHLHLRTGE
jgi:hypothetical protein